jgi:adhesin transport system membrane fusion protein
MIHLLRRWLATSRDATFQEHSDLSPPVMTSASLSWVDDADHARLLQEPIREQRLLYWIAGIVLVLLVWAGVAQIDEVSRGEGRVVPSSQLQIVQAVDGGVVQEVLVREGDMVEADAVLLRIDPTRFVANFRENRAEILSLQARAARLDALVSGTAFTPDATLIEEAPDVVERERRLYTSSQQALVQSLDIFNSQLIQRREELNEVKAKRTQTTRAFELSTQELSVTKPLLASGAISEVEILRLESDVASARGARDQTIAQEQRLVSAVNEAVSKLEEVELQSKNKWRNELGEALTKLAALTESGAGLADKIKYTEIRAPVRGRIQRIFTNTLGGVVQPGREVVELVPADDDLLIEAKLSPKEIAFLHAGQKAIVKFTAYDFVVYGGLEGRVEHISPDAITDEKDRTFYLVRVRTDRADFNPELPILPGMMTQVDILTGKKSILAYLLKPVLRAKQNALTER